MTQILWTKQALLPTGWADNVTVEIDADGRIATATPDTRASSQQTGLLLPAPANLHSHAFQRSMAGLTERRGPDPRDSFWTWRRLMYRFLDQLTPDDVQAIAALVQMEMLEAGYANNVEFHYLHHQTDGSSYDSVSEMAQRIAAAAEQTGVGLTLLPVLYEVGGCDGRALGQGQIRFGNDLDRFANIYEGAATALSHLPKDATLGVAPHSLRAVHRDSLQAVPDMTSGPVHMHLAEQVAEVEEVEAAYGARPVNWLMDNAEVDARWCLIHCTQMQPDETKALASSGAVAGLCPITESSLGDGIFDGKRYIENGGTFGVGSDSNIRISLAEELRTLEYSQRLRDKGRAVLASAEKSTGRLLFEGVVKGGAQAAGRNSGQIAAGQWADLLALDSDATDMIGRTGDVALDTWVFTSGDALVSDVWAAGRHVVQGGQHIAREAIVKAYRATMARLKDVG